MRDLLYLTQLDAFPTSPCLDHTRQHRQGNRGDLSRNHQNPTFSIGQEELSSQFSISLPAFSIGFILFFHLHLCSLSV